MHINKIISFLNSNENLVDIILVFSSLIISIIAIITSISTARKQNRIALLDKRVKFLDDLELLIIEQLPSWEFDFSKNRFFSKYTYIYVKTLFNRKTVDFYVQTKEYCTKIHLLWGDYHFAERHDTCNGKTIDDIQKEIYQYCEELENKYSDIKDCLAKKLFKI